MTEILEEEINERMFRQQHSSDTAHPRQPNSTDEQCLMPKITEYLESFILMRRLKLNLSFPGYKLTFS